MRLVPYNHLHRIRRKYKAQYRYICSFSLSNPARGVDTASVLGIDNLHAGVSPPRFRKFDIYACTKVFLRPTTFGEPDLFLFRFFSALQGGIVAARIGAATHNNRDQSHVSTRRPSSTLTFVVMTQLQFLATLSLVDSTVVESSFLADFVTGLR